MSAAFSAGVYLAFGVAILLWLRGQGRLSGGFGTWSAALIFWPAYLPICLAPVSAAAGDPASPRDPIFVALEQQIGRLAIEVARRAAYLGAVARLERALEARRAEVVRLAAAKHRLLELGSALGEADGQGRVVEEELERIEGAKAEIERDLGRVRESIVRLTLRLELVELKASKVSLEEQLAELAEELDRLVEAKAEVEVYNRR